jgi:hypothetical protein
LEFLPQIRSTGSQLGKAAKIGGVIVVLVAHGDPVADKGKTVKGAQVGGSSASTIEW